MPQVEDMEDKTDMKTRIHSGHLKERRKSKGWTQKYLADMIGVKPQSICNWEIYSERTDGENSTVPILSQNMEALVHAFGCSQSYLEGKTDLPNGTGEYSEIDPSIEIRLLGSNIDSRIFLRDQIDNLAENQLLPSYEILNSMKKLNPEQLWFIAKLCRSLLAFQVSISSNQILFPDLESFKQAFEKSCSLISSINNKIQNSPLQTNVVFQDAIDAYISRGLVQDYNYLFGSLNKKLKHPELAFRHTFDRLDHIKQAISKLRIASESQTPSERKKRANQERELIELYQRICQETILPQLKTEISQLLGKSVKEAFPKNPGEDPKK